MEPMQVWHNLKQRKVVQWTLAYLASAWLIIQLIDVLGSRWGVTEALAQLVDIALLVGLGIAIIIAWYHGDKGAQKVSVTEVLLIAMVVAAGGVSFSLLDTSPVPEAMAEGEQYRAPANIAPNVPDYWGDPLAKTLAYGQLGKTAAARAAAEHLLELWPTFEQDYYDLGLKNWMFLQPELMDRIIVGLNRAGLTMYYPVD